MGQVWRFGQVSSPEGQGALQFPRPGSGPQRGGLDRQQHPGQQRPVFPAEVHHSSWLCSERRKLEGEAVLWHGALHSDCLPAASGSAGIQDSVLPQRTAEPVTLFGGGPDVPPLFIDKRCLRHEVQKSVVKALWCLGRPDIYVYLFTTQPVKSNYLSCSPFFLLALLHYSLFIYYSFWQTCIEKQ